MDRRLSENTVSYLEWTVPRLSVLEKAGNSFRSPVYKFCDGPWTLCILREKNFLRCYFTCAGDFETHNETVVVRKSIQINGGDIRFHLPEKSLRLHSFRASSERSAFPWTHVGRADSLKITVTITCIKCEDEKLNKLISALSKRKYPEDDGKDLSLNKKLRHPSDSARSKQNYPEDDGKSFSPNKKLLDPSDVYKPQEEFMNWFTSGKVCDVILMVKGHEFRAHKDILRERSPAFFHKFFHNMVEENSGTIHITDCDPAAFQHFLAYLYARDFKNVSEGTVFSLYSIGDEYGMEEIKKLCVSFMGKHLTINTFCEVVTLSLWYKESTLLETALKFFVENFREITTTDQWKSFLTEHTKTGNDLHILATYHSATSIMTRLYDPGFLD